MKSLNDLIWQDETVKVDNPNISQFESDYMRVVCLAYFCGNSKILCSQIPNTGLVC